MDAVEPAVKTRACIDGWTEERTELAMRMWRAGSSAQIIGDKLNLSRSAIIGRMSRLGIKRSAEATNASRVFVNRQRSAKPRPQPQIKPVEPPPYVRGVITPPRPPKPLTQAHSGPTVALMDLTASSCRWPMSDDAPWRFCGRETGAVYCEAHAAVAYTGGKLPVSALAKSVRRYV